MNLLKTTVIQESDKRGCAFFLSQSFQLPSPGGSNTVSMMELQAWITACRTFLKTNMGSYLLRTGRDESLLVGDLHLTIKELQDLDQPAGRQ